MKPVNEERPRYSVAETAALFTSMYGVQPQNIAGRWLHDHVLYKHARLSPVSEAKVVGYKQKIDAL